MIELAVFLKLLYHVTFINNVAKPEDWTMPAEIAKHCPPLQFWVLDIVSSVILISSCIQAYIVLMMTLTSDFSTFKKMGVRLALMIMQGAWLTLSTSIFFVI